MEYGITRVISKRTGLLTRTAHLAAGDGPGAALCPGCSEPLEEEPWSAGPGSPVQHLAGRSDCPGRLRETAKLMLMERLLRALTAQRPLEVRHGCAVCGTGCMHQTALTAGAIQAATDMRLQPSGLTPDITLTGPKGNPTAVVYFADGRTETPEIPWATTHAPTVVFEAKSDADLDLLELDTLIAPVAGNTECPCPECERCHFGRACDPEHRECRTCQSEELRMQIPWADGAGTLVCNECEKPADKDATTGVAYTRCSCCINSILAQAEIPCYNDIYEHRHCRRCSAEIPAYRRELNPHRQICHDCRRAAREQGEGKPPGRETAKPIPASGGEDAADETLPMEEMALL